MKKLLLSTALLLPLAASAAPTDWVAYGHDAGGGRFSPLGQITPANVSKLQPAWTFHMNPTPDAKPANGRVPASTTTPLVADGLLISARLMVVSSRWIPPPASRSGRISCPAATSRPSAASRTGRVTARTSRASYLAAPRAN